MFHLIDLDERTRGLMLAELQRDIAESDLYSSPRLSPVGRSVYPNLLRDALETGTPESLTSALDSPRYFNPTEIRDAKGPSPIEARVPETAAQTLAEGEFNRYYLRALCRRAIEDGIQRLFIYRAKQVVEGRSESERRIGESIDPLRLLLDLRLRVETIFGVPNGPNSGLSARLPDSTTSRD